MLYLTNGNLKGCFKYGKKRCIAEKPSVARDIARVLNCNKKGNGYFRRR